MKLARKMISPSNGTGNAAETSVEELRALRRDALRQVEEAEAKAQRARLEAKAYTDAAEALMRRAYAAGAQAHQFDTQGNPEKAADARRTAVDLRKLTAQNYALADARGAIAAGFERQVYRHRSHAAEIEAQIRKKMEE